MTAKNKQNGSFRPEYFPEIISTPESVALREFYFERRRQYPIRKRHRPYTGNMVALVELLEVIE